ncbi:MAG: type III pantothenate kinase [Cyanobacteria bacterium J06623_4]
MAPAWLALVIGNTRLHWGYFYQERFIGAWHTPHIALPSATQLATDGFRAGAWAQQLPSWYDQLSTTQRQVLPTDTRSLPPLWVASAVSKQTKLWQTAAPHAHSVSRSQISISHLYQTIGIDRAINLLGAGTTVGWPALVIDGGTALTLTAGISQEETRQPAALDSLGKFYGGAILPGLRLQREALADKTATLGTFVRAINENGEEALPPRWATHTSDAIASGLLYGLAATLVDYITAWWQQFPAGAIIVTGGDAPQIHRVLQQRTPEIASRVQINPALMFYGMAAYRSAQLA